MPPRVTENALCTWIIWAHSCHSPVNYVQFFPFSRWRDWGSDRLSVLHPRSGRKRQDQGGHEALPDHEAGGRPECLLGASAPVNVLCLTLTPFVIVILAEIPATHVEYSSASSPICYRVSVLFHMKTINNRKGLDLVSKNIIWKEFSLGAARSPVISDQSPGRASQQPPRSSGCLLPSENTRLAAPTHKQTQRDPVSDGKAALLRGTLFL